MEELIKKTGTMLRAVLISSPRGVPLCRLDKEYRSITFEPIPYFKCGFNNLEEFLRSMPKVARIQRDRDGETVVIGVPSEADQHVAKLIAKQKKPKIKKSAARPARRPVNSFLKSTPAKQYTSRFGPRSVRAERPSSFIPKQSTSSSSSSGQSGPFGRPSLQTPRFVPPRLRKILGVQAQTDNKQPASGPQRVVTFGFSDLKRFRQVKVLQRELKKKNIQSYVHVAADDKSKQPAKTSKRPAKPSSKGMDFTNMQISLISDSPTESPRSPVNQLQTQSNTLSPEVLERIGQIAGKNDNGYFLKRLPVVYKEKYQIELPDNIAELLLSYPNTLRIHIDKTTKLYIAYPPKINLSPTPQVNVEVPVPVKPSESKREITLPVPVKPSESKREITLPVPVKPSESKRNVIELYTVKPYTIPATGTPVQVYVSHVESTTKFYVQYKDSEEKLKILLERLDLDMKETTECIPNPTKGMNCCAQFSLDGSWYRAQILECIQDNDALTVNVLYVDFGNSEMLPHTRLRYLKKEHVEVPQIAVLCSLQGVGSDDSETNDKLTNMLDKESTMTVIERLGDVLMVRLTDDNGTDIAATRVKEEDNATPVAAVHTIDDVAAVHTIDAVAAVHTIDAVAAVHTVDAVAAVHTIDAVAAVHTVDAVAADHTIDDDNTRSPSAEPEQKKPLKPFLKMKSVSIEQEKKVPERVVIPDGEFLDIMVSTVFSTDNISVMLYGEEHSDKLLALEISMMSYFAESSEEASPSPNVNEVWAIKSSELHADDQYYRVKVLSLKDQQAMLEFVDYGDTRQSPVAALKTLPARFLDLPFQAFTISLHDIPKTKKPQVLDKLKHHVLGKPLVAEVIQRTHESKLEVEIYDTSAELDLNINEVMRSLIIPDEDLVPGLPKVGHQVEARLSHITDTGSVFVQIPGAGLNRLEELMTEITEHYSKSTKAAEFVSHPSVGHICCAKCSDGSWYRAIILEKFPEKKVKVQCVDYGNTETLLRMALREPTTTNEHVNLLPFQAIECQLHGLAKESWTAEKTAKMNELVSEDVILEVTKQDKIPIVKLYLTTEDDQQINILEFIQDEISSPRNVVNDSTTTEPTDKESSSQEDDQDDLSPSLPPPIQLSRPWVDVTISDIVDPGHFMFQPLEMIKSLEEMTQQMSDHYNQKVETEYLVSPRNGDLCAVRYDDGQYYRAVVKAVLAPQQVCVLFIDYGNLGIHPSSDFRVLVDAFKQIPSIAVKGYLAGIQSLTDSGEWSDDAKKRFEELVSWKMLVGSVDGDHYKYDFREEHKVPMNLFDTSSNDKDINIAELLVNEGLARRT